MFLKKNRNLIIMTCVFLSLFLVFFVYLNITLKDVYFPYWDTYNIKLFSEKVGVISLFHKYADDPLFYYNTKIFHELTGMDYYFIIKYANFFFIAFLFFIIFIFFREIKKNSIIAIIIGLIYFFLTWYTYIRFSMTIRENLIISLGLLSIYLLLKFNQKNSLSYLNLVILSMIYSYLIGAHMLVALIAGGVIGIYFLDYLINKGDIKKLFIFIFLVCIISFPFIHAQYEAIIAQLHHGQEFITERGFTVSYSYIKSSYFNLPLDIFFGFFGVLFFIKITNDKSRVDEIKKYKIFLFYLLVILFGFFASYMPHLGLKQNRFAIYIYVILSFFLIFFFKKFTVITNNKFIFPLILILLFATITSTILKYSGYYPINEKNLNYIKDQLPIILDKYDKIYAGPSVVVIIDYLGYENVYIPFGEVFQSIKDLDKPLIIISDDYYTYKTRFPEIFEKFQGFEVNNTLSFDENSRTYIIMPINETQ